MADNLIILPPPVEPLLHAAPPVAPMEMPRQLLERVRQECDFAIRPIPLPDLQR